MNEPRPVRATLAWWREKSWMTASFFWSDDNDAVEKGRAKIQKCFGKVFNEIFNLWNFELRFIKGEDKFFGMTLKFEENRKLVIKSIFEIQSEGGELVNTKVWKFCSVAGLCMTEWKIDQELLLSSRGYFSLSTEWKNSQISLSKSSIRSLLLQLQNNKK